MGTRTGWLEQEAAVQRSACTVYIQASLSLSLSLSVDR